MWGKIGAVVVAAAIAAILVFLAMLASGPPGAPTATISATPNPSAQTTYSVTVTYQENSLVTPSFFGWNGQALVVTAWWTSPNGVRNTVEQSEHMVASVLSSHGTTYTIGSTFSFTIGAQCTTTCATTVLNVTVVAYGINPTGNLWSSATGPNSTTVFSNVPAYNAVPAAAPPPSAPYDLSLFGALTGALGMALVAVTVAKPNAYTAIGAAGAFVLVATFVVVWGGIL